jgi:hypothetical protein
VSATASIVLNVMGLQDLAVYGFRSWLIQNYDQPYEVILNLLAPCRHLFDPLLQGINPHCTPRIFQYDQPAYFNVSASNNLGLHHSTGQNVIFANADMIYPGHFLKSAMAELTGRTIHYAVAARFNMTPDHNRRLKPSPMDYTLADPFTALIGWEREVEADIWPAKSPWMIRRDLAFAIGGFDNRILMAEDTDLCDRAMHYLRRKNLQHALFSFSDLYGYHQWHPTTGLFNAYWEAKPLIDARTKTLTTDPNSPQDCVPTPLNDPDALIKVIRETQPPPRFNEYRKDLKNKLARRAKKLWKAVKYGK